MVYKPPEKRIHRGFFYLDDETVINSLSAFEAGKVDEVVSKVNSAREGGFAAGINVYGVKAEGGKKGSSSFEEEMVRTRTRFSIFEAWYQTLASAKALGHFEGWGPDVLTEVDPGHTVEFRASLSAVPLQVMFRLFLWFADQAKTAGTIFSQSGNELKGTKEAERNMRAVMGDPNETFLLATPKGDPGPLVAMRLADQWRIGKMGRLSGEYSIVAQVDELLMKGEEYPTLRLTSDVPPTPIEVETLRESVGEFIEPAKALGISVSKDDARIKGPAILITPIAIYR